MSNRTNLSSKGAIPSRLAFLSLHGRPDSAGFTHVRELAAALEERGWSVDLFESRHRRAAPGMLRRVIAGAGAQWRLFRSSRPDALYYRWHPLTLPTAIWARLRGVPTVVEANASMGEVRAARGPFRWLPLASLLRSSLRLADMVVAMASGLEADIGRTTPVVVTGNGVNVDLFSPGRALSFDLPDQYVVFVGELAEWQGVDTMLEALQSKSWPPDVALVIAGDGAKRPLVQDVASESDWLHYLGRIRHDEVPGLLACAVAGLSPQTGAIERVFSPLKLWEYMACGIPVVVADLPDHAGVVARASAGIVIPPDDPEALAMAVRLLSGDPSSAGAMGARGRGLVVDQYSWRSVAGQTDQVIRRAIAIAGNPVGRSG